MPSAKCLRPYNMSLLLRGLDYQWREMVDGLSQGQVDKGLDGHILVP